MGGSDAELGSKVLGKLQSYSESIEEVKLFIVPFTVLAGRLSEWDTTSRAVQNMKEVVHNLLGYQPAAVPAGAQLWKVEASTLAELVDWDVHVGS